MNRIPPFKPFRPMPIPVLPTVYNDSLSYTEQLCKMAKTVNDVVEFCNNFDTNIQEYVNNWLDEHPEATSTVEDGSLTMVKFTNELKKQTTNYYVTPEMYGAIGNGVADDTVAVQSALDSGKVVMLKGTYLVNASEETWHIALTVHSDTFIFGNGKIVLAPNEYGNYSILRIYGCNNVTIDGISVIGDGNAHTGDTGEWGYGIDIDNSTNITIQNVKVSNCWGDGIIVNHLDDTKPFTEVNKNVNILHCTVKHCGRNCITVCHGTYINIDGCDLSDAYRTAPKDLIDVEPDNNEEVRYLTITNCKLHENAKGIEVVVAVSPSYVASEHILIDNNLFELVDNAFIINGIAAVSGEDLNIVNNVISLCNSAVISLNANYNFINNKVSTNGNGEHILNTTYSGANIKGNIFIGGSTGSNFLLGGASDTFRDNSMSYSNGTSLIEINNTNITVKNNYQSGTFTGDVFKVTSGTVFVTHNNLGSVSSPLIFNVTSGTVLSFYNSYYGGSISGESEITSKYDLLNNDVVA